MAIKRIKLHRAIEIYFDEDPLMNKKGSEGTRKSHRRTLDVLRSVTSSQTDAYSLEVEHVDACINSLRKGASPEENAIRRRAGVTPRRGRGEVALSNDISNLKGFIRFLHRRNYLSAARNPTMHLARVHGHSRKPIEEMVIQPSEEVFQRLLEAAGDRHPRDRVVMAIGLYAGLRESEHLALRVGGVDFEAGELRVWRKKTKAWHRVPLHHVLVVELKRWFAWLEKYHGPLQPDWFVAAARTNCPLRLAHHRGGTTLAGGVLTPETPVDPRVAAHAIARDMQRAYVAAGYPGLYRPGAHTARRMAAIHITNQTGDRRNAKRMLGHFEEKTTEGYLQHSNDLEILRRAMGQLAPEPAPEPDSEGRGNVFSLAARRRVA